MIPTDFLKNVFFTGVTIQPPKSCVFFFIGLASFVSNEPHIGSSAISASTLDKLLLDFSDFLWTFEDFEDFFMTPFHPLVKQCQSSLSLLNPNDMTWQHWGYIPLTSHWHVQPPAAVGIWARKKQIGSVHAWYIYNIYIICIYIIRSIKRNIVWTILEKWW